MAGQIIQASFNAGEWARSLYARVDLAKYHSGAALLRNFFVDYRGGATASPGSRFIYQCLSGTNTVRIIPFQASLTVSYLLVFENQKLYFVNNGSPVLEAAKTITGITQANPGVVTSAGHGFSNGNRVYIASVVGMTQVNGNYYTVAGAAANTFQLADLFGNLINTTAYTAYTSGGTVSRVYTLTSPYTSTELAQLKFAQDVNVMIFNHPNYATYSLTLTSATNWTLAAVTIGSTVSVPTGQAVASSLTAGTWNYAYVITAVDSSGQESGPSAFATLSNVVDLRLHGGNNTVTWSAVTNAASYNVYKAISRSGAAVPAGSMFGFIGNCTATTFIDDDISADFAQSSPITKNPFSGSGVQSITITNGGSYAGLAAPAVTFTGGGGSGAAAQVAVQATAVAINAAGSNYAVFDTITTSYGVILQVISVNFGGAINAVNIVNRGLITGGAISANPYGIISTSGVGAGATFDLTFQVTAVNVTAPGTGYSPAPTVAFSTGAAAATAILGAPSAGNPTVPCYHQQRLGLLGPVASPNQLNFSQPGAPYNFNVTDPVQPDNAFQGTLKSKQLNTIQAAVSQPQGLIVLSDNAAWLLNGGSAGSIFDATNLAANPQIFNGIGNPPPIVAVDDILYVQSKGSIVRDLIFNYSRQVYTGADISIQSSHLFYGYQILEWAYAEEPFKLVWAVRNDGVLLSLTFLREQELIAWAHRDTQGSYKSIASITENSNTIGYVDAVYTIVQRTVNGNTVQYIERFVEQYYPSGTTDAWQVDAGLQYNGASVLSFSGAQHLAAAACVGLATDNLGNVTTFTKTVSATGTFTLTAPTSPATGYTRVTIGLGYTPQLQTLPIDTGDPTIQGKMKKIPYVTVRVKDTLGLQIGSDLDSGNLVNMDDLIIGNVGKDTNEVVAGLVSGDAMQTVDPAWTVPGQYAIQQSLPYPATILGVIPALELEGAK